MPIHRDFTQFGSAKTFYTVPNVFSEEFCTIQPFYMEQNSTLVKKFYSNVSNLC